MLSNEGYSVETAENGKKAIKACEKYPFDVALIDIELPDVKGTELLTKLKEIQPKIVEIIITGHPSMENAIKAVNQKADGYVLKPFEAPVLLETIKRLFAEKENEYFKMLKEVTNGKEKTPPTKFQNPDRW
jgi:DNA-binding NtrC family response regulator